MAHPAKGVYSAPAVEQQHEECAPSRVILSLLIVREKCRCKGDQRREEGREGRASDGLARSAQRPAAMSASGHER